MKSAGKARNNGLYRHIRTSKEIIRNLLNDLLKNNEEKKKTMAQLEQWGVKVEISDIVKHEELIDAKTKARNERRRLYEERKRQAKNKKNTNS